MAYIVERLPPACLNKVLLDKVSDYIIAGQVEEPTMAWTTVFQDQLGFFTLRAWTRNRNETR